MKVSDLVERELEMLEALRKRGLEGDNEASKIYLEQLRRISDDIANWQQKKDAKTS